MSAKLNCYAPGDGAMSFVWVDNENQALPRQVTMDQARQYRHREKAKHLRHYRPVLIDQNPRLVAPWKRINENTLELEGRQYNYSIDKDKLWPDSKEIPYHALTVTTQDDGQTFNVEHISTKSSMKFFLSHEAELTPWPCAACDNPAIVGEYCCLTCQQKYEQ